MKNIFKKITIILIMILAISGCAKNDNKDVVWGEVDESKFEERDEIKESGELIIDEDIAEEKGLDTSIVLYNLSPETGEVVRKATYIKEENFSEEDVMSYKDRHKPHNDFPRPDVEFLEHNEGVIILDFKEEDPFLAYYINSGIYQEKIEGSGMFGVNETDFEVAKNAYYTFYKTIKDNFPQYEEVRFYINGYPETLLSKSHNGVIFD